MLTGASSPKSFPPPGSSSLSCLGPDSSSPRSPWPALASGPSNRKRVTLLPPFLSDQAQQVQALGTFYLFCQATDAERAYVPTGPADVRFVWEKNRHALETCVPVQTHTLPDGRAHVLSWLRDAVRETTEYSCSVLSSAGNQTSKVQITVMRHDRLPHSSSVKLSWDSSYLAAAHFPGPLQLLKEKVLCCPSVGSRDNSNKSLSISEQWPDAWSSG
ncbi:hypothetical protein LEMLEM_LOCUS8449 [Lemmus lemmus]